MKLKLLLVLTALFSLVSASDAPKVFSHLLLIKPGANVQHSTDDGKSWKPYPCQVGIVTINGTSGIFSSPVADDQLTSKPVQNFLETLCGKEPKFSLNNNLFLVGRAECIPSEYGPREPSCLQKSWKAFKNRLSNPEPDSPTEIELPDGVGKTTHFYYCALFQNKPINNPGITWIDLADVLDGAGDLASNTPEVLPILKAIGAVRDSKTINMNRVYDEMRKAFALSGQFAETELFMPPQFITHFIRCNRDIQNAMQPHTSLLNKLKMRLSDALFTASLLIALSVEDGRSF